MSVYDGLFLLDGLQENEKREIISALPEAVKFKKGEIVYSPESFRRAIGFVKSGSVSAVTSNSQQMVMKRIYAGSCFGAAAVFGTADSYVSTVSAAEDAEICFITEETLVSLFEKHPVTAVNYIAFLSDRIRFLNKRLSVISCSDAENTVLKYLTLSADDNGYAVIPVSMTELSKMLGLGRASLYRSLEALEKRGSIIRENNKIKVTEK